MPVQKRVMDAPLALNNLAGGEAGRADREMIPKISVIMPVYNAGETVAYALHGLLAQTWSNIEILVIDDASSDDTCARVNEMAASDSRVVVLRQKENQGAYAARNEGLKHAQGEFIANHDADDWSHPQRLERMMAPLLEDDTLMASMAHWVRKVYRRLSEAWQAGIPSMLHVRESLEHDPDMCRAFRMSADEIRARVLASVEKPG